MDSQTIHIALASDLEGVDGLAVTVFSALEHSSLPMQVWVIEDEIPRDIQQRLEAAWQPNAKLAGVKFISMADLPLKMPSRWANSDWPMTAAARFQLGDLLPLEAHRCIYLDIDILVGADLAELFELPLDGKPVGMVHNRWMEDKVKDYLRSISLDPATYCNSGVLLMDLDAWRAENASQKLIETGLTLPTPIWFFDQDMINTYFKDRCLMLEERWNFRDAGVLPAGRIQHFSGRGKPWKMSSTQAVLLGHRAWHDTKLRTGFVSPPISAYSKWRKSVRALTAKIQRRLARA